MRIPLRFAALLCTVLAHAEVAPPAGPPAVDLRFAPTPGDYLRITLAETETATEPPAVAPGAATDAQEKSNAEVAPQKQTVAAKEIGYDWKIQDPDADGNTVIETSYAFIRVATTVGREVERTPGEDTERVRQRGATFVMDTRMPLETSNRGWAALKNRPVDEQPPGLASLMADLDWARGTLNRSLIGRPFTLVVSPKGQVLAVRGMDVIMDQYRAEMSTRKTEFTKRAQQDALIESFFGEDTVSRTMTLGLLPPYPARAVRPGETWSDTVELDLSGWKVPVTRKLALQEPPGADGSGVLSGVMELEFRKQGIVFEPPEAALHLTAEIDSATGMYQKLNSEGTVRFTARAEEAAADAAPVGYLDQRLSSSAVMIRFARRDPNDPRLRVFTAGNRVYELRLGLDWTQVTASARPFGNILLTSYRQAASGAHLTVSVTPPPAEDAQRHPLNEAAERQRAALAEAWQGSKVDLSWSKLFTLGPMRWARCRIEITEPSGDQHVHWSQLGDGPQGGYAFELSRPGAPSKEADEEARGILDNIVTSEAEGRLARLQKEQPELAAFVAGLAGENDLRFVPIPAGEFVMGSPYEDPDSHSVEAPTTRVRFLRPFFLGATEVTQAQWTAVMGSNPSSPEGDTLPVESVSWEDAMAFCQKLTDRERLAGRLPTGWVFTLPTEAQWEYACRAGTTATRASDLEAMAWYHPGSDGITHPVGTKQANAWGLSDMQGNVWEWCLDWYGEYPGGAVADPQGAATGTERVRRGGSARNDAATCRCANRSCLWFGNRENDVGFRLALVQRPEE